MSVPLMWYWSISSIVLTEEAEKLWLTVEIISKTKNLFYIKGNGKEILFKSTDFGWNSALWLKIANDKELTYKILEKHNLPTAKTWYILPDQISDLEKLNITFPVIIKPLEEWHGNWVMMNILDIKELKLKLKQSFEVYNKMIIQKQIEWEEFRVLVVNWEVIMARNRVPAFIIGDWTNTIQKLISIENKSNILRWEWYNSPLAYIKVDSELDDYIEKNWLTTDSIPEQWKHVTLRWNSNIGTWWISIDVTHIISDDIKNICSSAAKMLNLKLAWVDVITTDITKALSETHWIILEINSTPWIWWDRELTDVNTWKIILEKLFFNK